MWGTAHATAAERLIIFDAPATHFTESAPLGNGRLGAMVFGGIDEERVVLNESGMWSGSRQEADRPDAHEALPEIRRLLLAGKIAEAEKLVNERFTSAGRGSGRGTGANVPFGCYQTLGDLRLRFHYGSGAGGGTGPVPMNAGRSGVNVAPGRDAQAAAEHGRDAHATTEQVDAAEDYRRELDLAEAVARVSYERRGVKFTREAFVSGRDEAIVLRFTADQPGKIDFDAMLHRPERAAVVGDGDHGLRMFGQLNDGVNGNGVKFAAVLRAVARGGSVAVRENVLEVRGADEVLLVLAAATDIRTFAGRNISDASAAATREAEAASTKSYALLRAAHVAEHRGWFDRVELQLGKNAPRDERATADQHRGATAARLKAFHEGASDPGIAALYFNFGRYLLIASSRPGGLPANLQGIWAEEIQTPWNGDWHLNINVQMNYWPAEVGNLSELHRPLFDLIASLQEPGAKTARAYYNARGWVAHVITNPWGFTSPGEQASWGATSSGSAWLCQHLWDHYLFTRDDAFLRWAYPIMRGSALFYLDMLVEEPKRGWLVTAPTNSPENSFLLPDGTKAHIALGSTADSQLVRHLFTACIEASALLGLDEELRRELAAKRGRLAPTRIASDGRVMEWLEEYPEADPQHRHVAHLWGLYPGNEIHPRRTPELAAAARKTLDVRGDAGTGWGIALKMAMWARLGDGERAHRLLREHLKPATRTTERRRWSGGTYPNLFDAHPPFQIDGNFGGAAVIAEMLVQSETDVATGTNEIHLLPALPDAWSEGRVRGLRARGGFEVEVGWAGGELVRATVRSVGGTKVRVRYRERTVEVRIENGASLRLDDELREVGPDRGERENPKRQ